MAGNSSNSGRGKSMVEGKKEAKEIQFNDELQLDFILDAGIVKDCELSLPYGVQLTNDKWNLFLPLQGFEETLIGFLKEEEDVREGIQVNVYDRGGHEFEMMLKKWVKDSNQFYVLNRGWFSFCNQHGLGQEDLIALRGFRHSITDMLSFVVTFRKMSVGIVKDCKMSMPYWVELTNDKWNLFLCMPHHFEDMNLSGYLKKGEDVIEGIQVNVYDKGGHEFEMMLKKWVKNSSPYYVLNRGWFRFCNQHGLKENDFIAIRTFRHGITDKLSFAVTYQKMS